MNFPRTLKLLVPLTAAVALTAMAVFRHGGTPPAPPAPAADSGWIRCEGRVAAYPGFDVVVSTDLGGTLEALPVHEKDSLRRGQLLARIDDREQKAALDAAEARIREQAADISFQEREVSRRRQLIQEGAVDRRSLEDAETQLRLAQARLDAARGAADQFRVQIAKRQILAPIDGVVMERFANQGETLAPGSRILRITDLRRTRVEAEVDEFDLSRLAAGSAVEVAAEGTPGAWRAHVEELPDGVGPRRLKPQDPARPMDIRVLLVKVALDELAPLKLGQKVELRIRPAR